MPLMVELKDSDPLRMTLIMSSLIMSGWENPANKEYAQISRSTDHMGRAEHICGRAPTASKTHFSAGPDPNLTIIPNPNPNPSVDCRSETVVAAEF